MNYRSGMTYRSGILAAYLILVLNPSLSSAQSQIEVRVLATVHGYHLKKEVGYSLKDLENQILAIKPDLVCAELTQKDHGAINEGASFPMENAVVEQVAKRIGAVFYPSDWRIGYKNESMVEDAIGKMTKTEKGKYNNAFTVFMVSLKRNFGENLFAFYHSNRAQQEIKAAHDTMIAAGTEVAAGFWYTRNQMIVKNCIRKAREGDFTSVVFTYGGDHKYAIEQYLREFYNIEAKTITKRYIHSEEPVAQGVMDRWKTHLKNMKKYLKNGEDALLRRAIENNHMPELLEKAIRQQGAPV